MTRKLAIGSVLLVAVAAWLTAGQAARAVDDKPADKKVEKVELPLCPLMGEPVDFNVYSESDKGRVYFCCAGCIKKYEAKPEKYADAVKAQHEALHKLPAVQVSCPMSGEPIDPKTTVEHAGHKIAFCCGKCADKFKAEPAKYMGKLAGAFTYQTKCPISDHAIDPKATVKAPGGETVYLCCPKCAAVFSADPAKYASKLAEQGYSLNLKKK